MIFLRLGEEESGRKGRDRIGTKLQGFSAATQQCSAVQWSPPSIASKRFSKLENAIIFPFGSTVGKRKQFSTKLNFNFILFEVVGLTELGVIEWNNSGRDFIFITTISSILTLLPFLSCTQ